MTEELPCNISIQVRYNWTTIRYQILTVSWDLTCFTRACHWHCTHSNYQAHWWSQIHWSSSYGPASNLVATAVIGPNTVNKRFKPGSWWLNWRQEVSYEWRNDRLCKWILDTFEPQFANLDHSCIGVIVDWFDRAMTNTQTNDPSSQTKRPFVALPLGPMLTFSLLIEETHQIPDTHKFRVGLVCHRFTDDFNLDLTSIGFDPQVWQA
jgi:hypothetical protein